MNKFVIVSRSNQESFHLLFSPVLSRLCIWLFVGSWLAGTSLTASGATFNRKGSGPIVGEVISATDKGIVFKTAEGRILARIPYSELVESEIAGDAKVKAFRDAQAAKEKQQSAKDQERAVAAPPAVPRPGAPGMAKSGAPAASTALWKAKDGVPGEVETQHSFLDVKEDCKKLAGKTIKLQLWVEMGSSLRREDGPTPEYEGYYGEVRDGTKPPAGATSISSLAAISYAIQNGPCIFFPKEAGRLLLEVFESNSRHKLGVTFVMEKVTNRNNTIYYIMHVKQIDRL